MVPRGSSFTISFLVAVKLGVSSVLVEKFLLVSVLFKYLR